MLNAAAFVVRSQCHHLPLLLFVVVEGENNVTI
jgi:hypothetical protein